MEKHLDDALSKVKKIRKASDCSKNAFMVLFAGPRQ